MLALKWIGKQAVVNHQREVPYRLVNYDDDLSVVEDLYPQSAVSQVDADTTNWHIFRVE